MSGKIESYVDYLDAFDRCGKTGCGETADAVARVIAMMKDEYSACELHARAKRMDKAMDSDTAWTFDQNCAYGDAPGISEVVVVPMRLLDRDGYEDFRTETMHAAMEMMDSVVSILDVCAAEAGNPDVSSWLAEMAKDLAERNAHGNPNERENA